MGCGDMTVKKIVVAILVVAVLYVVWTQLNDSVTLPSAPARIDDALATAIREQQNDVQVTGVGVVTRILDDDTDGSRHQRFVLTLATGQTLLIAHNIDIAPRIPSLELGDSVEFSGVYEWNPQGGVIHWTHHDPDGRHEAGWLRHEMRVFR